MSRAEKPLVLDSTVLSNFASSESVSWLTSAFSGLETAPSVERELRNGIEEGYSFLRLAVEAIDSRTIAVSGSTGEIATSSDEIWIVQRLDQGEAEALVIADRAGGTLVTDDMPARKLAREQNVPTTGSVGLLVNGIVRDELSIEIADRWLETWRTECDYYAPVESVIEALPDDTE